MAGTISYSGQFRVSNDPYDSGTEQWAEEITQNAIGGGNPGTISIATTVTTIDTTGVTTLGWARIRNLDSTNYVDIGPYVASTLHPFMRLKAGEPSQKIRLTPGIALAAQANTAACKISVEVWED